MDKIFTSDNIKNIGIAGILAFILFAGYNENWVWGTTYREVKAERDEWKKTAMEGLRVAKEISPARIPILAGPPGGEIKAKDVIEQLNVVKNINSKD